MGAVPGNGIGGRSRDQKSTKVIKMTVEPISDSPVNPTWLGVGDVAARLGVVSKTVYRMIDNGSLTAYRIGRVIRVKESDLVSYEDSCRIQPGDLTHLIEG